MNLSAAKTTLKLSALLLLAAAPQLSAQVNYGEYNFIIQNNVSIGTGGAHINGGSLIGGDLTVLGSTSFGQMSRDQFGVALETYGTVYAGKSITLDMTSDKFYLANNTIAPVGTNPNPNQFTLNPNGSTLSNVNNLNQQLTSDPLSGAFGNVYQRMKLMSQAFASATVNGNITGSTFSANTSSAVSYVDISTSSPLLNFDGTSKYTFSNTVSFTNVDANHKLIINVELPTNSTFEFTGSFTSQLQSGILWNITGASAVNLRQTGNFYGSIMAVNAHITDYVTSQNVYGQIVGSSFTYTGTGLSEFHGESNYSFFTNDMVPPIPEPSTYALFGAGSLAGLALFRRHRRKAA